MLPNRILYLLLFTTLYMFLYFYASIAKAGNYPVPAKVKREEEMGSFLGNWGISLETSTHKKDSSSEKNDFPVNSFLWKASLEAFSFVPLASTDAKSGTIITEWYESKNSNERFKFNVIIAGKALTTENLELRVFKQVNENGKWKNSTVSQDFVLNLEDKIIRRAREYSLKNK